MEDYVKLSTAAHFCRLWHPFEVHDMFAVSGRIVNVRHYLFPMNKLFDIRRDSSAQVLFVV